MKRIPALLLIAVALLFWAPAYAASPSDELQKHAPASSKVLIGVNVPAVKQSFLFKDMLNFIKSQPASQDVLGFILSGGFLDIEKDIQGFLIATPATTMPSQPGQNIPKQDVALLVNGNLDKSKVLAAAKSRYGDLKESKVGKRTVWDTGSFKFTFAGENTLILVSAEAPFTDATWKAVDDPKASVANSKEMKSILKRINTSSGIWMGSTQPPSSGGAMPAAPVENMALSMDIAGRLRIDMKSETKTETAAKQMAEQLTGLKTNSAQSPMVQALGAGPLLANLEIKQKGTRVDLATRMTNSEFKSMFERIKALQGAGGPPTAPASQPTSPVMPAPTPKDGANADFN